MPGHGTQLSARRRPAALPRVRTAAGLLLAGLAVLLLLLAGVDLAATAVAEDRVAAAVSEALGQDVEADIGPWPATPRLLARGDLQVRLRAEAGEQAGGDAGGPLLRALDVTLSGATPASDWSAFTAERAQWSVALEPARTPLGLSELAGSAKDVSIATAQDDATLISAGEIVLDGAEADQGDAGPLTAASAQNLALRLERRGGPAHLSADRAGAELDDGGTAALPMGVQRSHLELEQLELTLGGAAPSRVRADSAVLRAGGVPLQADGLAAQSSGARLDEVVARLPMLAIDHADGAPALEVRSEGATFSTSLDEGDLAQLWDGPGTIVVSGGTLRLSLPLIAIDVDVRPEGRALLLTPLLPPAVEALLGEVPPVVVTPDLPEGLAVTEVQVGQDVLQLRGGGDRFVVPLG